MRTTTATDLFDKARRHERVEQLAAAREHDLVPYLSRASRAAW